MSKIERYGGGFIGLMVVLMVVSWILLPSKSETPPAPAPVASPAAAQPAPPAKEACAKDNLRCLAEEGIISASVYCPREVERRAKHAVKWTDGFLESKFDRFKWKDQAKGVITYVGGKAQFQNGFGAFTPVIYECDLAPDNRTILDVRVREGRLAN